MVSELEELCEALLRADPDIREIVQFGSSVYAPELALDIDLLVTTALKKDSDVYWDAVAEWPLNVDVLVREPGELVGDSIGLAVVGTGKVLYGNGTTIEEVRITMPIPTYEEARELLLVADRYLDDAHEAPNESQRHAHYRTAFNALFDAARHAAMTYLSTEETRWGELRKGLPKKHSEEFRAIVNTLHVAYFYRREYPQENVEGEFHAWRERVGRFIDALEQERGE
ncbi:MAG: hypothetical protein ACE5NP_02260 [Anaerolineae bacterium]